MCEDYSAAWRPIIPRWQGEPLTGKSIVIGLEAGQGDMIQFARYAAVLKSRGAGPSQTKTRPAWGAGCYTQ